MKTTLYSILSAAVRVAALIMLARTVSGLVAYFASADAVVGPQRWAMAIGSAASAGIALMLWLFPGFLVRPATCGRVCSKSC